MVIFIKYLIKFYLNIKFYSTVNDPLPVLPGNEQDLSHKNMVNTYLFYQVCKVHDIVCFENQFTNEEKS